jgi:ankyrin repeat protein
MKFLILCKLILILVFTTSTAVHASRRSPVPQDYINYHLSQALVECSMKGDLAGVRDLLQQGAALRVGNNAPLFAAAGLGHTEIVELLIAFGAPLNTVWPDDGYTPLLSALDLNQEAAALALLKAGARVDIPCARGNTPLMLASKNGNPKLVEALLGAGALPNERNEKGDSALIKAIKAPYKTSPQIVSMLLAAGACQKLSNKRGYRPYDVAQYLGKTNICKLLSTAQSSLPSSRCSVQ